MIFSTEQLLSLVIFSFFLITLMFDSGLMLWGEIRIKFFTQLHTTLCIQFLDRENDEKNNSLPSGKQICFTVV